MMPVNRETAAKILNNFFFICQHVFENDEKNESERLVEDYILFYI